MIRVFMPTAPAVLLGRGATAAQVHCNDHNQSPADYRSGVKKFKFDKSVYAAPEVKEALRIAQHKKCAFCESLIGHVSYGAVEHFRPKGGYKQGKGDRLKRPGYYWLAYEWSNLLFCCQLCNEQFKQNHFPLKNGRARARSHTHQLSGEEPLLIHPVYLDPSGHIEFRRGRVIGLSAEGKATIRILGLNRSELREARERRLQTLSNLLRVRGLLREQIATASTPRLVAELANIETMLQESRSDTAEYTAMTRTFLGP